MGCSTDLYQECARWADFGRNAWQTSALVSKYGPPIKSMQYGTAAKIPGTSCSPASLFNPSSVSAIALGWPGKLMIKHLSRTTAHCRDKIAVGTNFKLICRICSPKPGMSLCATASVASGVTSRSAGPVPPVVSTRLQPTSTSSINAALIRQTRKDYKPEKPGEAPRHGKSYREVFQLVKAQMQATSEPEK